MLTSIRRPAQITFFIGTNRIVPVSESFEVFGGAKIGGVTYASKGNGFNNVTKFAVGISAGMSYFFLIPIWVCVYKPTSTFRLLMLVQTYGGAVATV